MFCLGILKTIKSFGLIARIALEIHQLQDVFDGALLADPTTLSGGAVKDQILLFRLDRKREFVGLTFRDGGHCTPGALVKGLASLVERIKLRSFTTDAPFDGYRNAYDRAFGRSLGKDGTVWLAADRSISSGRSLCG